VQRLIGLACPISTRLWIKVQISITFKSLQIQSRSIFYVCCR